MTTVAEKSRRNTPGKEAQQIIPFTDPETPAAAAADTLDIAPSEKLRTTTIGCRLRLQRLAASKGFDDATKTQIAQKLEVTQKRIISGSYKIYDEKHPAIREHNEFFSRVEKYWKGMTLPLSSAYIDESATEGGVRLLRRDQADEFHARMRAFKSEAETIAARLNGERPGILAGAQSILGPKYNAALYPDAFMIGVFWGFPNVDVPSYLARLAPEAYAHERQLVAKRFEDTYELATTAMLQEFHAVINNWVEALSGPVIRLFPDAQSALAHLHDGEVARSFDHAADPAIPDGSQTLVVRYHRDNKTLEETIGPLTQKEYEALRPREVKEKHVFRDSTVENLVQLVDKFRRLGATMSSNDKIETCVREIQDRLAKFRNTDETIHELRNSRVFREETHKVMQRLSQNVAEQIQTFRKSRKHVD